jgi:hypothetical protein
MPGVAAEVLSSSLDDHADAARLAELVQQDQALTTHVLQIVNFPAFRSAIEIVTDESWPVCGCCRAASRSRRRLRAVWHDFQQCPAGETRLHAQAVKRIEALGIALPSFTVNVAGLIGEMDTWLKPMTAICVSNSSATASRSCMVAPVLNQRRRSACVTSTGMSIQSLPDCIWQWLTQPGANKTGSRIRYCPCRLFEIRLQSCATQLTPNDLF